MLFLKVIFDSGSFNRLYVEEILKEIFTAYENMFVDILPTAKAGGFCGQTAIAAEGSLTSPSARENALSL